MLLLHVPVSTKRPWIHYFNYPICDCSELNNAAARASDTPTEMEIRRQPQRRSATRARCVVDGGGGEDWTISPSVSRYLRDASHWPCLHSQPQVGMLTICI